MRALLDRILTQRPGHPLRVAVDGPDAAGKTTLADTLAAQLADLLGGAGTVRQRYRHRYLPGQRLYREQCAPAQWADFVIGTSDGS